MNDRRLAVVTGGSGGIGRAVAAALLDAGCGVLLTGRSRGALEDAAAELSSRGAVETVAFDVTDPTAIDECLRPLAVDVLVYAAGHGTSAPLARTSLADWDAMLAVHATGAFLCTQAVLDGMRARDWGRIIVVASVAGLVGMRYIPAYTAAKHAAVGLVRAVAAELTGTGVTANAVCPHFVDTPMTDMSVANVVQATGRNDREARAELERMVPLGRLVRADEVAAAVAYFASPEAAAVNGQTLVLDGGGTVS